MLTRIEVKNYKLFRHISQPLDAFHILVGANATGKTTFLDVVSFVSDIVRFGLEDAVARRTESKDFKDLTWASNANNIEIALEFAIPYEIQQVLKDNKKVDTLRFEIELSVNNNQLDISYERIWLLHSSIVQSNEANTSLMHQAAWFSDSDIQYQQSCITRNSTSVHYVVEIGSDKEPNYYSFKPIKGKSALENLPPDLDRFPTCFWLKEYLETFIQKFMLDSETLRKASPPNQGKALKPNGGNLPWVLEDLKKTHAKLFKRWLAHIRTSLPDVKDIRIIRRKDDAHKYFKVLYENGAEVPSWLVSDGTLRMLALTLLAYLPDFKGIYLIEEPENGIHPKAVETIFQSLSSVYGAQVLVASHSTAFLSVAEPKQLLCFSKDETGEAHIIKGNEHPRLQHWKGETNLSILFAGGVLE